MKQVVFAVLLLAMASFTGCLTDDESSVDENTETIDDSTSDTTEENSDTTDDTKDDELIDPVGTDGITIPKDSSVFMDGGRYSQNMGNYECSNPYGENGDRNSEGYSDDEEDDKKGCSHVGASSMNWAWILGLAALFGRRRS